MLIKAMFQSRTRMSGSKVASVTICLASWETEEGVKGAGHAGVTAADKRKQEIKGLGLTCVINDCIQSKTQLKTTKLNHPGPPDLPPAGFTAFYALLSADWLTQVSFC